MSITYFAEGFGLFLMLAIFAIIITFVVVWMLRSKKRNMASFIALGMGLVALGITVLVLSSNLVQSAFNANEAAMIPKLWATILIPSALFMIYRVLKGAEEEPESAGRLDKVLTVAILAIISVFLMKYIGYFICSALFVFFCMHILGYKKLTTMIAISLSWVAFSYLIFYKLLWVTLPVGSAIKAIFKI
jgi:putative tricarboxylic transport membrane protein